MNPFTPLIFLSITTSTSSQKKKYALFDYDGEREQGRTGKQLMDISSQTTLSGVASLALFSNYFYDLIIMSSIFKTLSLWVREWVSFSLSVVTQILLSAGIRQFLSITCLANSQEWVQKLWVTYGVYLLIPKLGLLLICDVIINYIIHYYITKLINYLISLFLTNIFHK